jgi:hypothetical protein
MSHIETITNFLYNNQRLSLKTSNFDSYLFFLHRQTAGDSRWHKANSIEKKKLFANYLSRQRLKSFYMDIEALPNNDCFKIKKIIDVGSGVAQIPLLMSQIRPEIDFYLLDKNLYDQKEGCNFFSKSLDDKNYHGFYNSFDIVKDIIAHSPIQLEKIHFLYPEDQWPDNVDLIMSQYSWMWHYHKNIYWSRLLTSLNVGGYLSVTISLRKGENLISEISEELGSHPCIFVPIVYPHDTQDINLPGFNQITHTGYYVWQRLK